MLDMHLIGNLSSIIIRSFEKTQTVSPSFDSLARHSAEHLDIVAMLWVEKDLAAAAKAVFDRWDSTNNALNHQEFLIAGLRTSIGDVRKLIEKGEWFYDRSCSF